MKSNEKFLEILNEIDDKYIEEVEKVEELKKEKNTNSIINFEEKRNEINHKRDENNKKRNIFNIKYISIAASLFLIPVILLNLINKEEGIEETLREKEISMYNETDSSSDYYYGLIDGISVRSKNKEKLDIKYINELKKEKDFYIKLKSLNESNSDIIKNIKEYYIDLDEKIVNILTLSKDEKTIREIEKLNTDNAKISIH